MNEITLNLDKNSSQPLYIQLYLYIREEIKCGRIKKCSQLPSIRTLAKHLNVSKITVDNAYQQLLVEGYIESKLGSGMYVIEIEKNILPSSKVNNLEISSDLNLNNIEYDFNYGSIDTESFDFNSWKKFSSQALSSPDKKLLQYGDPQGELELRDEISKYLRASRGVLSSKEQVIITSGTSNSLQLICELIDDKSIAIETPGWDRAKYIFQKNNFKIIPIPLDKNGISLKHLKKTSAKLIYITPSHQFPSGIVMPIAKRQKLLNWALDNNSFIIEDDYDSEFRYTSHPIPALQSIDNNERVIYLGTFSKSLAPALRISYMILPKKLLNIYYQNLTMQEQQTSRITQKTLQLFMAHGYWERHIRKMRKIYSKKYNTLIKSIESEFDDEIRIIGGNAGLHILIEIRNGMSEDTIIDVTTKAGIKIYPTSKYWADKTDINYPIFLIGFGALSEKQIVDGIKLLKIVLNKS